MLAILGLNMISDGEIASLFLSFFPFSPHFKGISLFLVKHNDSEIGFEICVISNWDCIMISFLHFQSGLVVGLKLECLSVLKKKNCSNVHVQINPVIAKCCSIKP